MNAYHENFRFEDGVLHVHLSGIFPEELLYKEQNLFQPLIEACTKYDCHKALVDVRDLQLDFDTMALYRAGEDVASMNYAGLCIAFLARADTIDPFFEDVASNRGGRIGIFTDIKSALAWLEE